MRYFSIAVARVGAFLGSILRDVLTGVPSQDFIDKGLISDAAPTCFLAELIEHSGIDANRGINWRGSSPSGGRAMRRIAFSCICRRIGNVRKINLLPRTPHARGGSRAAR